MSLKLQVDHVTASTAGPLKLQLGCGLNLLPGWINTDSQPVATADYLDFTRPFPFAADAFDAAFCEHTIEHIEKTEALKMISEVFRVLKPGGRFRVVTPSLENFCRLALEPQSPVAQTYLAFHRRYTGDAQATIADAINRIFTATGIDTSMRSTSLPSCCSRPASRRSRQCQRGPTGIQSSKTSMAMVA